MWCISVVRRARGERQGKVETQQRAQSSVVVTLKMHPAKKLQNWRGESLIGQVRFIIMALALFRQAG